MLHPFLVIDHLATNAAEQVASASKMVDLPIARTMQRWAVWLCILVWCEVRYRQAPVRNECRSPATLDPNAFGCTCLTKILRDPIRGVEAPADLQTLVYADAGRGDSRAAVPAHELPQS
jgi:hypothetical protein